MCGGLEYTAPRGESLRVYFPNPRAALPVRLKSGDIAWVAWGRRREQPGRLPEGGWARLDSVRAGKWARYRPRPVQIPAVRFMEKDAARRSHWFEVAAPLAIQGLLAEYDAERRVYVVTVDTPPAYAYIHDRWPRLVAAPGQE